MFKSKGNDVDCMGSNKKMLLRFSSLEGSLLDTGLSNTLERTASTVSILKSQSDFSNLTRSSCSKKSRKKVKFNKTPIIYKVDSFKEIYRIENRQKMKSCGCSIF